jgi:thiosulfate/3-mercaptopyruvate sulfurtransferase
MTRYVIIGAGAVGATIAAELHQAGREVVAIARGAHGAAIAERGLTYLRPGGVSTRIPLQVAAGPADLELRLGDILVVATKSQDTERVAQDWSWRPVTLEDGSVSTAAVVLPVLSVQNGVDNERVLLRRFARVYAASVWLPGMYVTAGEIASPGEPEPGLIWLGSYPSGLDEVSAAIARDLRAAGFGLQESADVMRFKYGKLRANLGNAVNALYGLNTDAVDFAPLTREAERVLNALGIGYAEVTVESELDVVGFKRSPIEGYSRQSSTWQSLARRSPVESDFLNGEIVLLARQNGLSAPLNEYLQQELSLAATQGREPGTANYADFERVLRAQVLVTARQLTGGEQLLDVRWALGDPDGRLRYQNGHIPGAVYVDLDTELAAHAGPESGRHPIPSAAQFQASARRWGLLPGKTVVVYDNNGNTAAARAWWLLRNAGVDVRILDGGLSAWTGELETGDVEVEASDIELRLTVDGTIDISEAASFPDKGILLDARAGERYRGEVEPVDPRAGHIPGAISAPTGENLAVDGKFLPAKQLRDRFATLGVKDDTAVGVYCGSGVTAAHQIAALAIAGIDAQLYPGSWSQWSNTDRPAATGPE